MCKPIVLLLFDAHPLRSAASVFTAGLGYFCFLQSCPRAEGLAAALELLGLPGRS